MDDQNKHINFIAEDALIGSLLIDNGTLDEVSYLQPEDFGLTLHRDAYRAICILINEGKNADIISVSEFISPKDNSVFTQICEIANSTFTPRNIKYYADTVKQYSIDRKMLSVAQEIISDVHNSKENRLDYAQKKISEVSDMLPFGAVLAVDVLSAVLNKIDERQSSSSDIIGMPTGFSSIDKITQGLCRGHLIILAARPSMGKTLLAMNIAENMSISNKKIVVIFSLEMNKEELVERSVASLGKIDADLMKSGKLDKEDFEKIALLSAKYTEAKLFIEDNSSTTVSDIRSRCRRIKREHGLDLVIVDYIGLVSGEGENETDRVSKISRSLKLLARDLNVPIIAVSQLNRGVEQRQDKRPTMSDLRQSGAIEQDADLILFIYRDAVYNKQTHDNSLAEINIAKNRHGELGTIYLKFNSHYCRFDNYIGTPSKPNSDKIVKMHHYYDR